MPDKADDEVFALKLRAAAAAAEPVIATVANARRGQGRANIADPALRSPELEVGAFTTYTSATRMEVAATMDRRASATATTGLIGAPNKC